MSTRLRNGLIDWAIRLGRRLLQWLARRGVVALVKWMRKRVSEVFDARLQRAKRPQRVERLRGRIKRWLDAALWLERHSTALAKCTVGALSQLAKDSKHIPLVSECEKELVAA